ncbi:hypothetical protein HU200_059580 [Digitaria exilis]|uniref:Uncharacterized protein n=1 Tax=Digitaria exilis TaxID=1010633 RepID=A0A835ACD4_9POAL|nr:hypothetical protein HU200_059580 [Digitaria exilis]CAB3459562.1 unnamed protein product [Digitaria exilis]
MGPPQRQQQDQARPAGSACVWVVAVLLLLAVLAGGGCLVLYMTLPPAEVPQWLPAAGLALVALPWAFWIATCAYRCCCSSDAAAEGGAPPPAVARQPSSRKAGVASAPSSKSIRAPRSARHATGDGASPASGSPTASSAAWRVRFGDTTVLGEDKDDGGGSSVHSNENEEAPLAYKMQPSS